MFIYRTLFALTAPVTDILDANAYLHEEDMTVYLKDDNSISEDVRNAVEKIEWTLKDESSGYIELKTIRELSDIELKSISEFVSGQTSDGIGEGFESQSFAQYEDEGLNGYEGSDWDDEIITASFEWPNEFIFEKVN